MDQATYDRVKSACDTYRSQGGRIVLGHWGLQWKDERWDPVDGCTCALGAVAVVEQPKMALDIVGTVGLALGATSSQVESFIEGFDDGDPNNVVDQAWYEAGCRMRQEQLLPGF